MVGVRASIVSGWIGTTATSVHFCLVVAIADGDALTARCGEPGAYEQVKVRIADIDTPEKAHTFG